MTKPSIKSLKDALSEASAPPKRKPARATALSEYDDEPTSGGQTPSHGQTPSPIAPARDYNKRANSIERDAMPKGMFPGTSKKLYDALYLRTRGAIKPSRTIRATKKDLSAWAGIKNRKTIDAHLRYFDMVGLVRRQWLPGQNDGYQFEVVLPEELGLGDRPPVVVRPLEASDQKMVRGSDQISGSGGQTQVVENKAGSIVPQTIKTSEQELDDDAALANSSTRDKQEFLAFIELFELLSAVSTEITGKPPQVVDAARWREFGEVLVTELRIAAARTAVSSVPAFLAEHLRRRLWKQDKKAQGGEAVETPATQPANAKDCPDCGGSGLYYPDGYDKGVAKCKHDKISKSES